MHTPAEPKVVIGLNAVVTAIRGGEPVVLCVRRGEGLGLPYGAFDPARHRTFDLGMRDFVARQTALTLGYAEQLYTFGDEGREAPQARISGGAASDRVVSVGYLALSPEAGETTREDADWRGWYAHFPWEDRRRVEDVEAIIDALSAWAARDAEKEARLALAFGLETGWQEERALDRYELMYEAGLVHEACRDGHAGGDPLPGTGEPMTSDHRRILATAIGRLRGKLRYRPIALELVAERFTLSDLQAATEGVLGFCVHKQNFRRAVEGSGLAERTNETVQRTGGRPASLYVRAPGPDAAGAGLSLPRFKPDA